tara:strand:- start:118 stop:444 length:327 start_codon:yes stop_codon:yes gene_type:complete
MKELQRLISELVAMSDLTKEEIESELMLSDTRLIYKVYENDDYGRPTRLIQFVEAVSQSHARLKVAVAEKSSEIYTLGYYGAKVISQQEIDEKKAELQSELDMYSKIN